MSQQFHKQQAAAVLDEARLCLQAGYFTGALNRALRLQRRSELGLSARHVASIARFHLGESHWADALKMNDINSELRTLGQGLAELCLMASSASRATEGIRLILETADLQHGVWLTWHPTAILLLAEFAATHLKDSRSAILLVCMALGFRSVFVSRGDVDRLAKLLIKLNAPVSLWADWCTILIQHIQFSTKRAAFLQEKLQSSSDAVRWSLAEDAATEGMVKSILAAAPGEVWTLLWTLAPHLDAGVFGAVVKDRFSPNSLDGCRNADALWSEPRALRYRYFWYDMMTSSDQDLVRNGDWAMFGLPTGDFSMALAQWWRVVESVLKHSVIKALTAAFVQQPQLLAFDRANLTQRQREDATVFPDKLAVPEKATKMTLYDILLILRKCEATNEKGGAAPSRSRLEAAQILKEYSAHIGPLTKGTWLNPAHLTDDNIKWFRNRSAHDESVSFGDAAVGRLLARRILSGFFLPVLKSRGFEPVLL